MIGMYIAAIKYTTAANAILLQCTATFWLIPLGMHPAQGIPGPPGAGRHRPGHPRHHRHRRLGIRPLTPPGRTRRRPGPGQRHRLRQRRDRPAMASRPRPDLAERCQ